MSCHSCAKTAHWLVVLALVLAAITPALGMAALPQTALAQSATPAPVLLSTTPANGNRWDGGAVVFTFDKEMATATVAVAPSLAGEVAVEGANITFTPSETPAPDTSYRLTISAAQASDGSFLANPVSILIQTTGPFAVSATQPSDGAEGSDPNAPIVVIFNRPAVPLMGVEDQAGLPQPLSFDPAVEGTGQWISTSVYQFQPATPLAGGMKYAVTVAALTDVAGEAMAAPYTFSFTIAAPIVLSSAPSGIFVSPTTAVTVTFSQPMDPASSEAAFTLTPADNDGASVEGAYTWNMTSTVMVFTPAAPLDWGVQYNIAVADTAQSPSQQGHLRDAFGGNFTVVPLPAVASTSILPDAEGVNPESELRVRFTAPVSSTSVLNSIQISPPPLSTTQVVSYTYTDYYENTNQGADTINVNIPYDYGTHLTLNWYKDPKTTYTVSLGPDITDMYGNTLGEPYNLTFTTGDYPPLVQIDLDRFTSYSAYTMTVVGVKYRNVEQVDAELYKLSLTDLYQLAGENSYSIWDSFVVPDADQNRIWAKSAPAEGEANTINLTGFKLDGADGKPLPPGIYLLEVRQPPSPDDGQQPQSSVQKAVIVLSNNNITFKRANDGNSLAWVTGLQDGLPVNNAEVTFTKSGATLGSATTGDDGIAVANLNLTANDQYQPAFAATGEPGKPGFAVVSSDWNTGIEPWSFNVNTYGSYDQVVLTLYSDRPIYRPGQTVDWKGIVRVLKDDIWTVPDGGTPVTVKVQNNMGTVVQEQVFQTNDFGTLNGEFLLAPDATTGYYSLNAEMARGGDPDNKVYGSVSIQVAEYVKPEFEINTTTNQPSYIQGETITATVQADYYSGSPLVDAPVDWRIIASSYSFSWPDAPDGKYYSFDPFDPDQVAYDPYAAGNLGVTQEGKGVTGSNGAFVLTLPADLGESISSQTWSLDTTITSPTSQQVYVSTSFPVHRGEFYVGLSPQSYVVEAGKEGAIDVITLTPDYQPYPEAELEAVVYSFQWSSVYEQAEDGAYYWKSTAERTPVFTTTITTGADGTAVINFVARQAGQYQVTATGKDTKDNTISSAVYVYASGAADASGYVPWPRENNDRIELVADKKLYKPGDTAKILVPNPFTGPVKALVTLERSGVIEARVIELTGSSQTIDVPVTAEQIPNVFVGVVLVKGVDETNPYVATRVGYAKLSVDTAQKQLTVDIKPSGEVFAPGDVVTYTITVTDDEGNPAPNAETSLALVDKAVLSLAPTWMAPQSLVSIFYSERPLGVTTGSLIVINQDRVSQQLAEGGKGGGGGGGDGGIDVREEFPDTAYWRADALTNENGVIEFSLPLPDSLTTWVLTARSITADTLVGEATNEIVVTKDLQVRPALPRFFTAGDRAIIGGVVLNTTDAPISDGTFTFAIAGATLDSGDAVQSFTAEPNVPVRFDFPISVDPKALTVVVTMTAQAGDLSDGVKMTLPVLRYQSPEVVATGGMAPPEGVTEAIYVPKGATDEGELTLTLDPSLAAGLMDGLAYLEHYPYECNEQTVSRFLPNLFTVRALRQLGIEDPALESSLSYQIGIGVQRLVSRQNADGGWGYWADQESAPFISAYVLWGLVNADQLGYTVDANVLSRGADYLGGQFVAPDDVTEPYQLNQMTFMHYVLASMYRGDAGRMSTLYDVRERLDSYGQAFLAMAMNLVDSTDPRVGTLMDGLLGSANLTATGAWWTDETLDLQIMATDLRSTAIILDAFVQTRPSTEILPNVVRWLMSARQNGRWQTTQENAWSIMALTDWMSYTGELQANYDWSATLNDTELGKGSFTSPTDQQVLRVAITDLVRDQANLLAIGRSDGPGQLYYTTYLRYFLDAMAIPPADRGMTIERSFFKNGEQVSTVQEGDILSVTVTIVAPTNLYHVMVQTPIPAGTEALNPDLPTGPQYGEDGQPVLKPIGPGSNSWYSWTPASLDYRDDSVNLFATYMPAGTYQYTFQLRAAFAGEYRVLPAVGEMMYFPEVWGRSAGQMLTITK
ncbi:MAG: Ig-like domain-containing protein [Anaerolineales bacterium]|nr:Ig-like domain-containing protein [Anaerolineales bacterium]